ncbi:hypothetical protein [Niabella terrae]
MKLKTIEIDIEVYKRIESERNGFEETPNEILRRLLRISQVGKRSSKVSSVSTQITSPPNDSGSKTSEIRNSSPAGTPKDWFFEGVRLLEGTRLRKWYHGKQYHAVISNGGICFEEKYYKTPSAAAMAVTGGMPVNGWLFWEYYDAPVYTWKKLQELRKSQDKVNYKKIKGKSQKQLPAKEIARKQTNPKSGSTED